MMSRIHVRRHRSHRHGFSLLEMVVALAIVGVLVAVVLPAMENIKRKSEMNDFARKTLGDLREARVLATSGRQLTSSATPAIPVAPPCPPPAVCSASIAPPTGPGGGGAVRVRFGGIRIASTTSYTVFGDDDNVANNGGERDIEVFDFLAKNPSSSIRIIEPPVGSEIRFTSTGTHPNGANRLVLQDAETLQEKVINISTAGMIKFQ